MKMMVLQITRGSRSQMSLHFPLQTNTSLSRKAVLSSKMFHKEMILPLQLPLNSKNNFKKNTTEIQVMIVNNPVSNLPQGFAKTLQNFWERQMMSSAWIKQKKIRNVTQQVIFTMRSTKTSFRVCRRIY